MDQGIQNLLHSCNPDHCRKSLFFHPTLKKTLEGITKEDFLAFQQCTQSIRDAASSIAFDPRPEWFDTSIGMVVKATYAKPGETTEQGGVISNGADKWFFLHSTNLRDLSGPGFMLTEEMLPFLYQKWRQPNTIAKNFEQKEPLKTPLSSPNG